MARANLRDDLVESLEAQVDALRKEIASLRRNVGKRGARAYDEASESAGALYEDLAERWYEALPVLRKRARYVEQQAKDNPATAAAVALVVVGLLATLFVKR